MAENQRKSEEIKKTILTTAMEIAGPEQ